MNPLIIFALTSKTVLASMLLVAGGAKFADLDGFAAAVRLLTSFHLTRQSARLAGLIIALTELITGMASLALPEIPRINLAVVVMTCAFLAVSLLGYVRHRGRSCRCFGALSRRSFDGKSLCRNILIASLSTIVMVESQGTVTRLSVASHALLFAGAGLIALTAFSAGRALGAARSLEPEMR